MKTKIVCFGPGPQFKGGLSNYNTSLAKAFDKKDDIEVHIVSWTQQYPAIVPREFVDKTSELDFLKGTDVRVKYITNYNNPRSWKKTVEYIESINPEIVIFQWSIALQGLPLSFIAKWLKKKGVRVLFDLHFVIQKEHSTIDKFFTKKALKHVDNYVVHAYKTADELKEIFPERLFRITESGERYEHEKNVIIKQFHPIYDLFEPDDEFDVQKFKEKHDLKKHVFLFFGFIRKYKGLHHAIRAFAKLREERDDISLIICGESFWKTLDETKLMTKVKNFLFGAAKKMFLKSKEDEKEYRPLELIKELGIEDDILLRNEFIPNEDVNKYFQVSDNVLLFYEYATPSGIESLSYNFSLPILATKVGHFPETIQDGFNGYLAEENNIDSMVEAMRKAIEKPIEKRNIDKATEFMSWENYSDAILSIKAG